MMCPLPRFPWGKTYCWTIPSLQLEGPLGLGHTRCHHTYCRTTSHTANLRLDNQVSIVPQWILLILTKHVCLELSMLIAVCFRCCCRTLEAQVIWCKGGYGPALRSFRGLRYNRSCVENNSKKHLIMLNGVCGCFLVLGQETLYMFWRTPLVLL